MFASRGYIMRSGAVISATAISSYMTFPAICSGHDETHILTSQFAKTEKNDNNDNKDLFVLKHLVIVMRHGDRAPVSKSIGPKYPHTKENDEIWRSKVVNGLNLEILKGIAKSQSDTNDDNIYTGRDVGDYPYGQLTEIGVNQLVDVGAKMRRVYVEEGRFLPTLMTEDDIYSRSTNLCRTMNSLRSLLIGLYDIKAVTETDNHSFPKIQSYPTHHDPMIDGVTTDIEAKNIHRKHLFEKHSLPHGFIDFQEVNAKLKDALGYPHRVNYHVIREHLVCHRSHDLPLPIGLDDQDIEQQYKLEMWVANILYGDRYYNSHEIGSFMGELRDRLAAIKTGVIEKLSIYSAHDYTLIPLLIGLEIMPDDFPFYATNLKIEIATKNPEKNEKNEDKDAKSPAEGALYARLLWNDEAISLPGEDSWCPLENFLQRLHAGYLGKQHSQQSEQVGESEESEALNSMNELDDAINDELDAQAETSNVANLSSKPASKL